MKPKYSKPDSRGKLFVDCSECKRGGKGDQTCSSGWKIKTGKRGGCFIGELLDKYKESEGSTCQSK
ncbi:hypothetical protein [Paenibacillus contaminans]|uniref:Uncharacterized protein n=1 Tax=Paenibacillus contaminans TaxID=450362 RepID=A0A329MG16_9BACL|nr:hypothetical protein [Paenibacillus contaminans]RAV18855.1 hypothetical protein DQG23_24310 [Paenibacillus contaminans]